MDEQILGVEEKESSMQNKHKKKAPPPNRGIAHQEKKELPSPDDAPFKIDTGSKFKPRGMVRTFSAPKEPEKKKEVAKTPAPDQASSSEDKQKEDTGPFRLGASSGRKGGNEKRLVVNTASDSDAKEKKNDEKNSGGKKKRRRKSSTMRLKVPKDSE